MRTYTIFVTTADEVEKEDLIALLQRPATTLGPGIEVGEIDETTDYEGPGYDKEPVKPWYAGGPEPPGWNGAGASVEAQRG